MRYLKNTHVRPLAVFLFLAVLFGPRVALANGLATVVKNLQVRYDRIKTLEADFTQVFHSGAMGSDETSHGRVFMKKPGKIRWQYTGDVGDEIISDGKTVWVYQPDLNQAVKKTVDGSSGLATDFLSGIGDLKRDFDIALSNETATAWTLELTPRASQPNIQKLFMDIDKTSGLATKTVVVDSFGNETRVSFENIKTNNALKDSLFKFTPPKGASVIRP